MNQFKWGIIGPGSIAADFAKDLSFVKEQPHIVHAILCTDKEKANDFVSAFSVKHVHTELTDFLSEEMDAVYIATPHTLHHEQALACLQATIPVLCEKPISINSDQLQELMAASQQHQTFLMEGMWIRFLPSIQQVIQLLNENKIGKITSIKATMSYKAPHDPASRYFNPDLGGGSLLDLGIYPIFLSTLLLGKPVDVKAVGVISAEGIDEACSILLSYKNKQFASLESSLVTETDLVAEILGEKGRIKILSPWNEMPKAIVLNIYNDYIMEYPCSWQGRGFQYEVMEVVDCIREKKIESLAMPHSLSLQVMDIMDKVREQLHVKYEKFE